MAQRRDLTLEELKRHSVRLGAGNAVMQVQADGLAAVTVATGLLLGLLARERGAGGQSMLTTMLNSAAHAMSEDMVEYASRAPLATADSELHGLSALYRLYETSDGWVFLAAPAEHEWPKLVLALAAHVDLADARFETADARRRHDGALADALQAVFVTRPAAVWEREMLAADVGCVVATEAPIESVLMSDEFGRASGLLADVVHPTFDAHPRLAPLVRYSRSAVTAKPACLAGQHTDAILSEIGYSDERIGALRADGIIG